MKQIYRFSLACVAAIVVLALSAAPALAQHIVIDPGHGGNDPGGTGTGMKEKDVVLDTSLRFRDLLEADTSDTNGGGTWTVSLTRDTDVFIPLASRSAYANSIGADRFMSIHANAFGTSSANGTETFSYSESGTSADLRNLVQEEMLSAWGLTNRGNKTAGFSVLANTAMPAELHELGFITNPTDAPKLASAEARQGAAIAHLRALQRHFGIEPYLPGDPQDADTGSLLVAVLTESDAPISGARVMLAGVLVGETNGEGELLLNDLTTGEHLVAAGALGFNESESSVEVSSDEVASIVFVLEVDAEIRVSNCDSQQPCNPQVGGLTGGCSTHGGSSGLALALLVLGLLAHVSRRHALAQRH